MIDLDFGERPGDMHWWGGRREMPWTKPEALAFTEIEPGARAPLKHMVRAKDCVDGGKGASHHQGTVWIE